MRKVGVLAVSLAVMLAACDRGNTVAEVGGEPVSKEEFAAYLKFKRIPEQDEQRRQAALRDYVERSALAQAVEESGALDKDMLDAELNEFRKEMLISRYFQKYLDDMVTEDAIQSYYAQNADKYQETKVRVAHILQRTHGKMSEEERKAKLTTLQEAYSKVRAGTDFAEVAKTYSEDKVSANRGGDLGWLKEGAVSPRFSEVAFGTGAGDVSEPFETPFGFHIVKVLEAPMVVKRPLEAVKGDIRYQLRNEAKEAELKRLTAGIKTEILDEQK